jgi:hypothetical protein
MNGRKMEGDMIVGGADRHPVQLTPQTHKRLMKIASELGVRNANMAVMVLIDTYEGNGGGVHN